MMASVLEYVCSQTSQPALQKDESFVFRYIEELSFLSLFLDVKSITFYTALYAYMSLTLLK